ncbi:hypothetical protein DFQ29_006540 [Apophysomyces sp. BC1021]|nr:hypothetical protein DFQ29_006540 [Apophysomyces sp. BC1021]
MTTTPSTTTIHNRPTIPQLNIPHPASQPFPNEIYPAPPPRLPTPSKTPNPATNAILPSPNTLPAFSQNTNFVPLYIKQTPSPPTLDRRLPPLGRDWEQENKELKQELAAEKSQAEQLKQRVHDLEVENKVLRSLIMGNQKRTQEEEENDKLSNHKKIKTECS